MAKVLDVSDSLASEGAIVLNRLIEALGGGESFAVVRQAKHGEDLPVIRESTGQNLAVGAAQVMAYMCAANPGRICSLDGGIGAECKKARKQIRKHVSSLRIALCTNDPTNESSIDASGKDLFYKLPRLQILEKQLEKGSQWNHPVLCHDHAQALFSLADIFAFGCLQQQLACATDEMQACLETTVPYLLRWFLQTACFLHARPNTTDGNAPSLYDALSASRTRNIVSFQLEWNRGWNWLLRLRLPPQQAHQEEQEEQQQQEEEEQQEGEKKKKKKKQQEEQEEVSNQETPQQVGADQSNLTKKPIKRRGAKSKNKPRAGAKGGSRGTGRAMPKTEHVAGPTSSASCAVIRAVDELVAEKFVPSHLLQDLQELWNVGFEGAAADCLDQMLTGDYREAVELRTEGQTAEEGDVDAVADAVATLEMAEIVESSLEPSTETQEERNRKKKKDKLEYACKKRVHKARNKLRKRQQIANLAMLASTLLRPGQIAVDFCCGGGHLGLALAALRPDVKVVLLDANSVHIAYARTRCAARSLTNVSFERGWVDNYAQVPNQTPEKAQHFHLGIALHACASASDEVQRVCARQQPPAGFVLAPCCHGGLQNESDTSLRMSSQNNARTSNWRSDKQLGVGSSNSRSDDGSSDAPRSYPRSYPLSQKFRAAGVTPADHATISRCACFMGGGESKLWHGRVNEGQQDSGSSSEACTGSSTAGSTPNEPMRDDSTSRAQPDTQLGGPAVTLTLANPGRLSMALVDYDRVLAAREFGYEAFLLQMRPPRCSPKNHILCAYYPIADATEALTTVAPAATVVQSAAALRSAVSHYV
jgi:hypothetical protein